MEPWEDFEAEIARLRAAMDASIDRLSYAPPGSVEQQVLMQRHTRLYNEWQELVASRMDRVADTASDGHPMANVLRNVAAEARAARVAVPIVKMPPGTIRTPGGGARSRERRQRRHVARSTSSADSGGDPPPPHWPAHGLAVCPLCANEAAVRWRCPLCRGLGYIGREHRNRWKRGERP
jgi:hypothetical protein